MSFFLKYRIGFFLTIVNVVCFILGGCGKSSFGKIDLSRGSPPEFLKIGETSVNDVLEKIGEPLGYRNQGNRSAMIFTNHQEEYYFFLVSEIRIEKAFRLDLVFENMILEKVEVRKEGWGFGGNIDPQLLQLLAR